MAIAAQADPPATAFRLCPRFRKPRAAMNRASFRPALGSLRVLSWADHGGESLRNLLGASALCEGTCRSVAADDDRRRPAPVLYPAVWTDTAAAAGAAVHIFAIRVMPV
tara:strand:- start:1302 stop:1628 length:327 start_codon:yes stop_codon:yes gene_type:complete